jgi:hypothetical protein
MLGLAQQAGHVVLDDGAGYGNVHCRGKTKAILTLRQFWRR